MNFKRERVVSQIFRLIWQWDSESSKRPRSKSSMILLAVSLRYSKNVNTSLVQYLRWLDNTIVYYILIVRTVCYFHKRSNDCYRFSRGIEEFDRGGVFSLPSNRFDESPFPNVIKSTSTEVSNSLLEFKTSGSRFKVQVF